MDIQKKVVKSMVIITVVGGLIYSSLHFYVEGIDIDAIQKWVSQVEISIFTGALVTGMVSYVSERQMKKDYFFSLGKDFSRLFNCVDDYISILMLDDLYFEEYYSFRTEFLGFVLTPEKEGIALNKKEEVTFRDAVITLYLKPSNLLYYSYIKVKRLEKEYLREKNPQSHKVRMYYKEKLDIELKELNEYMMSLKAENKYNVMANKFYKRAGVDTEIKMTMDDCESEYKDQFYDNN